MFRYLYHQTGLNHFHSTDLDDMRRALLDEDQDGPDGGCPDAMPRGITRPPAPRLAGGRDVRH